MSCLRSERILNPHASFLASFVLLARKRKQLQRISAGAVADFLAVTSLGSAIVDFHRAYARAVVEAGEDGRVEPGWQRRGNRRLLRIRRRQAGGGNLRSLGGIILPVVIGEDQCAVLVTQLERRIGQGVRDAERGQARAETAHNDAIIPRVIAEDEPGNHHAIAGTDEGACAQVDQLRSRGRVEIVDFEQADSRRIAVALD